MEPSACKSSPCIHLKNGEMFAHSKTDNAIARFFNETRDISQNDLTKIADGKGSGSVRFRSLLLINDALEVNKSPASGEVA
jgi:hypothetical protein